MTATTARHRPAVVPVFPDDQRHFQMQCTCGVRGREHPIRVWAERDLDSHTDAIAAPPDERCTDTKAHGAKPWDACRLCRAQEVLFDL